VRWTVTVIPVAADLVLAWKLGATSIPFLLVNDSVLLVVVVGVTNLWAQGGLRARDLAILAGVIAVYDLVATGLTPLTGTMVERLAGFPFLPMAAWPIGEGRWIGIGVGDLLLASVGPLVLRKAFGPIPGLAAGVIALVSIGLALVAGGRDGLPETVPTMVVLGPLMVAQYWWWRRIGAERRSFAFLAGEPRRGGG
jgi:hypothetical protein